MTSARLSSLLCAVVLAAPLSARAQDDPDESAADGTEEPAVDGAAEAASEDGKEEPKILGERGTERLKWSYLWDGGALPFFWGSGALALGAVFLTPPDPPRGFSDSEGGLEKRSETIPTYQATLIALVSAGIVALPNRPERFYHLKGYAEAAVTATALSRLAKNFFGRHRPSYVEGDSEGERKSFYSGHATTAAVSLTYLGIYLQNNVFPRWRDSSSSMAWWEPVPLASLTALAGYVSYTRVDNHRHYWSDVIVGAGVGASLAVGFYAYQQWRYRHRGRKDETLVISPAVSPEGFSLIGHW